MKNSSTQDEQQEYAPSSGDHQPAEEDPHREESGVLLSDRIESYVKKFRMIEPFCKDNIKAAGYSLSVGKVYYLGGEKYYLNEMEDELTIPPYEVAVIQTKEIIRLPRFLIGRWNIRVSLAYKGLLWIGAAQVDPGFSGYLSCPIYNLSSKPVSLKKGGRLALMDFVKTTSFRKGTSKEYQTKRRSLDDYYDAQNLESALAEHKYRVDEVESSTKSLEQRMTWFTTIVITLLGILTATRLVGMESPIPVDWALIVALWMSSFSFLLALFVYLTSTRRLHPFTRLMQRSPFKRKFVVMRLGERRVLVMLFALFAALSVPTIYLSVNSSYEKEERDELNRRIIVLEKTIQSYEDTQPSVKQAK